MELFEFEINSNTMESISRSQAIGNLLEHKSHATVVDNKVNQRPYFLDVSMECHDPQTGVYS